MIVKAETKSVRISAYKAREVARHIQGRPAMDALEMLQFYPQKAARHFHKTLKSALANAENNHSLDPAQLMIKEAVVGEGPTLKRFAARRPRLRQPHFETHQHLRILLEERTEKTAKPAAKRRAAKRTPAAAAETPATE
ncbi:MAG: 50S ribosomal protein L22 [Bdellovibrionaceae bacterium]|nr:50S ribosomal protein L22 [Pseudobdellovibrionaceae bacterium]